MSEPPTPHREARAGLTQNPAPSEHRGPENPSVSAAVAEQASQPSPSSEPKAAQDSPSPTIHDLGYRRYHGPRTPHTRRYIAVLRLSLRQSMKWWLWLIVSFAVAQVAVFAAVMYFLGRAAAIPDAGLSADAIKPDFLVLKLLTEWYGVIPLTFLVGLFAGGPAIADDARTGGFQFYFSRPVSKEHYLLGKLLAVCGLTCLISSGPVVLLCLVRVAMVPPNLIAATLLLLARGVLVGLIVGITLAVPVVALSSLSSSRGIVQGGWAAVFLLSWVVGRIVASLTSSPWPALISLPTDLHVVAAAIFGERLPDSVPVWSAALFLGALIAASLVLLRARLRSAETIEVSS